MNVPLHTLNKDVYGETGRYPLQIRISVKCIRYWLKLVSLPMSRICRQEYEMLLLQHESGHFNWVSNVKKILSENGFGMVWLSQGVGFELTFIAEFKDRLISCYTQNWHSELENNDKYRWFHSFKSAFQAEKYLSCITNKWHRDNFARFRLRVSGLKNCIQWFGYNHGVATCPACNNGLENEVHFFVLLHSL